VWLYYNVWQGKEVRVRDFEIRDEWEGQTFGGAP
jgi:hypothetical protein